jgi:protein involved in polysaccharide export with SLBB domain
LAVIALLLLGQSPVLPATEDAAAPDPDEAYRIQIGDQLGVKFFLTPDLNEEVIVRPDGRISLQLIPEVAAAGRTPAELSKAIENLYSAELDTPEIAVIVRSFTAQRIYVDGEVRRPGEFPLNPPMTVLQGIALAGGLRHTARQREVILIRTKNRESPVFFHLNLKKAKKGKDPSQHVTLEPFDIVFVPRSNIANVNKWFDLYVRQNIPISFRSDLDLSD